MPITRNTPFEQLPTLLKPEEFGSWTGIGRSKTYQMLQTGELPSIRFGRLLRIPRDVMCDWFSPRED